MNFGYVSSVNDELKSGFSVYPNPSNGIFTIENSNNENINFSIRNVIGQKAYQGSINAISNSVIDLSHLESGIYTIEFDGQVKQHNQKLIIQ